MHLDLGTNMYKRRTIAVYITEDSHDLLDRMIAIYFSQGNKKTYGELVSMAINDMANQMLAVSQLRHENDKFV